MFIDFEGIDGSGKTTLSNRLVERLRAERIPVTHAREGGTLPCPIARKLRSMTRDTDNVALDELSELLLACAREIQVIEEVVRPALARGDVVVSDRYFYSHAAMATFGRGVEAARVQAILEAAADGLWPELVVLIDVDPALAKVRKRVGKLVSVRELPPGRKGLAGVGLLARVREGFLAQARRDPNRFFVLNNDDATLAQLEERILEEVRARLSIRVPALFVHRVRIAPPHVARVRAQEPTFDVTAGDRATRLEETLLDRIEARMASEPACAALLLGRIGGARAERLREELAQSAPRAVLRSIVGIDDAQGSLLRLRLAEVEGRFVARSLAGLVSAEAMALRERLALEHPAEIALSLRGVGSASAMRLRERLWKDAPYEVLRSLGGIASDEAWALRDRAGIEAAPPDAIVASLAQLDEPRAWALRRELFPTVSLIAQLQSIRGCTGDPAWPLRQRWLAKAPRPVLVGLLGLDDERAWALRQRAGKAAKEALDSIAGMAGERAQQLRERLAPYFPGPAILSLAHPPDSSDEELLWALVGRYGGYLLVLRAAAIRLHGAQRQQEAA